MNRATRISVFALGMAIGGMAHASSWDAPSAQAPSLQDILKLRAPTNDGLSSIRARMIRAEGHTVGYRAGLAHRGQEYRHLLEQRQYILDTMFQFQTLIGPGGVEPPVIVEARDVAAFAGDQMRTATRVFKIIRPARLVSVPPSWRDYLYTGLVSDATIDLPQGAARPKTPEETSVWQAAVKKGWAEGQKAADAIFTADLHRLTRNYNGMLRYSILLQQGMIEPTTVAESRRAVTGSKIEIRLNDRLRRITHKAELKVNPENWRPGSPLRHSVEPRRHDAESHR